MWSEDSSTSAEQDEDRLFVIVLIKVFSRFAASLEKANRCQVVLEHASPPFIYCRICLDQWIDFRDHETVKGDCEREI